MNSGMHLHFSVQNNTNELLTVEGASVLNGTWDEQAAPVQGEMLGRQRHRTWSMTRLPGQVFWLVAWLRLGSTKGYFTIGADFQTQQTATSEDGIEATLIYPSLLDCDGRFSGLGSEDIYLEVFIRPLTEGLLALRPPESPRSYAATLSRRIQPFQDLTAS